MVNCQWVAGLTRAYVEHSGVLNIPLHLGGPCQPAHWVGLASYPCNWARRRCSYAHSDCLWAILNRKSVCPAPNIDGPNQNIASGTFEKQGGPAAILECRRGKSEGSKEEKKNYREEQINQGI